ncbi:MAG: hypothetical protein L0Y56_10410 [Nitrospira sp.]|nr:hypothetical protein [Nitrospira sp.]
MNLTRHEIGVLREYMQDLVEQAKQELHVSASFKHTQKAYIHDDAILDLLAILDDRIESEGAQMGLSYGFAHQMWNVCNAASEYIRNYVWLNANLGPGTLTKVQVRQTTYRALLEYIERGKEGEVSDHG